MSHPTRVVLTGAVAIVAFDTAVSLLARQIGFPYERASFGSYVIYIAMGFFAARGAPGAPLTTAAIVAAIGGLVDASLGWAVSWALGPGRVPDGVTLTPSRWLITAVFVIVFAAVIGVIGGLVGRRGASTMVGA